MTNILILDNDECLGYFGLLNGIYNSCIRNLYITSLNNKIDYGAWCSQIKKTKAIIDVEKQEVDDDGHIVDLKQKALQKFRNR